MPASVSSSKRPVTLSSRTTGAPVDRCATSDFLRSSSLLASAAGLTGYAALTLASDVISSDLPVPGTGASKTVRGQGPRTSSLTSGVTRNPTDAWLAQQLREATPFGDGPRYLIRDNDRKYGRLFARVAAGTGIEVLRTPYGAPKANAICERFLGSVRRECLDHFLILSERHLYRAMKEYQEYFNCARPHQGIGQRIPCRTPQGVELSGKRVISRPVLGGLHHDYRWRAAERPSYPRAA